MELQILYFKWALQNRKYFEIEKRFEKLLAKIPEKISKKLKLCDNVSEISAKFSMLLAEELTDRRLNNLSEMVSDMSATFLKISAKFSQISAKFSEISVKRWQKLLDEPCEELVSIVYQYLLGYVLKGGTRAYSSGSLDFRDTFVSVLLFRGSYVWIKFRDVAPKRTVYRRSKRDEAGRVTYHGKYVPRFKPPREKQSAGTSLKFNYLPLGGYDSQRDAEIVYQIAAFYYVKDEGRIELGDGSYFIIPPMPEQEQSLSGLDKVHRVAARAKEVFRDFQLMNDATNLPSDTNAIAYVGVHDFSQYVASEKFSLDALLSEDVDAHLVDWEFTDSLCAVGEGLEGTSTSPYKAEQVVLRIELPQSNDVDPMTKQESPAQQLNEHLEAKVKRRISEQHEQHLQREKQLEERVSQLQLENEYLKSLLH